VSAEGEIGDLIVVVADIDAANAVSAILKRREAMAIREIRATVDRYIGRDSGCYGKAHDYLRPFIRQFSYAIVLDPELEAWVWSDSPQVDRTLGWAERSPNLRTWLEEQQLWPADIPKPHDPKHAMERALRAVRKRRSPALLRQLAERVSLRRCSDPAFIRLKTTLQRWFPAQ